MTSAGFTTCLWFDGQAEEAANHYTTIFEDSSSAGSAATPRPAPAPPAPSWRSSSSSTARSSWG
jgi:predicted 3-demethylubiquinone-9 3-methyltransferase (glyoxalase superfamily)